MTPSGREVNGSNGGSDSGGRTAAVRAALSPILVLLAIMWVIEVIDVVTPWDLDGLGIESRTGSGLIGIPLSPFLHAGFAHLWANTIVFLVLGFLVALRSQEGFWTVTGTIGIIGGLGVWLLGPSATITVGASGLIFGYLAYLLVAGFVTKHWLDLLIGLAVLVVYGGLLLSVLPTAVPQGVSWLAHLTGAIAGALAALWFAKRDGSPAGSGV